MTDILNIEPKRGAKAENAVGRRLADIGVVLPKASAPTASYVPVRRSGNLAFVSGQVPRLDGLNRYVGRVGVEVSVEEAKAAARLCTLNMLAQLSAFLGGDLDRVSGCIRVGGYVNAVPEFGEHPDIINAASDLIVAAFGESGRHARIAVGCGSLPRNVSVEIEGVFEIDGERPG